MRRAAQSSKPTPIPILPVQFRHETRKLDLPETGLYMLIYLLFWERNTIAEADLPRLLNRPNEAVQKVLKGLIAKGAVGSFGGTLSLPQASWRGLA